MIEALDAAMPPEATYIDNFASELRRAAGFIAANAPRGLRPSHVESLLFMSGNTSEEPRIHGLDFEREEVRDGVLVRASCTIYFEVDIWCDHFDDAVGNHWRRVVPELKVSWSSWGSCPRSVAAFRLGLMNECLEFADKVAAEFSQPIFSLVRTKAERDECARQSAVAKVQHAIARFAESVRETRKGMRVGDTRNLLTIGVDALVPGSKSGDTWEVGIGSGKQRLFYVVTRRTVTVEMSGQTGSSDYLTITRVAPVTPAVQS